MSWKKIKLSEFLKNRDCRYKPNDTSISGFKRIDKIDFSGNLFLSDKASNTDMILVKKGDLVISGINIEKGAMTVYEGEDDITATIHYSSYIYDKEKIDIEFLKYFLKSSEFKQAIKEQVPGGIKTEIKPKHLLPLEVSIPTTIEEQKIVVENLKSIEKENLRLATEINTQLKLVKQLRQSFLREAMQGKLIAQSPADGNAKDLLEQIKAEKAKSGKKEKPLPAIKEEEIPFEIPENWVWCRLGQLIQLKSGQDLKPDEYSDLKEIGLPYITGASNLENEKVIVNRWTNKPRSIAVNGELLLTCKGSGLGKMAWMEIDEAHIARQIMAISTYKVSLKFVKALLDQKVEIFRSQAKSSIPGIDRDIVLKTLIPLPPLLEQQRIVEKLDDLMRMCDEMEQSIKASQEQNEKLLQQVLREALRG